MAYNPYMFYQPMQDTLNQFKYQPQPQAPIIWVQGEAGAKAYIVAPNNTAVLWDSERNTIYIKTADASGLPNMRILDFTERVMAEGSNYIKNEDKTLIEAINGKLDSIYNKLFGEAESNE